MNNHITLKLPVPTSIRLEVYKKALDYFREKDFSRFRVCEKGKPKPSTPLNLNMLLPCLLWDLNCYTDDSPNGKWDWDDTDKAFPEIRKISLKLKKVKEPELVNKIKYNEIKNIIYKLSYETK